MAEQSEQGDETRTALSVHLGLLHELTFLLQLVDLPTQKHRGRSHPELRDESGAQAETDLGHHRQQRFSQRVASGHNAQLELKLPTQESRV